MIYHITIRTATPRKNVDIYAHPAWPFVMNQQGDPTEDYKVLFVEKTVRHDDGTIAGGIGFEVFQLVFRETSSYQNDPIHYSKFWRHVPMQTELLRDDDGAVITNVEQLEDLRVL